MNFLSFFLTLVSLSDIQLSAIEQKSFKSFFQRSDFQKSTEDYPPQNLQGHVRSFFNAGYWMKRSAEEK